MFSVLGGTEGERRTDTEYETEPSTASYERTLPKKSDGRKSLGTRGNYFSNHKSLAKFGGDFAPQPLGTICLIQAKGCFRNITVLTGHKQHSRKKEKHHAMKKR